MPSTRSTRPSSPVPPPPPPPPANKRSFLATHAARRRKRRIVMNVTAVFLTLLILAVCAFWIFAFALYTVGSNSMAPTLLGSPENRDRVLCWMLAYHYREPRRWETAIFQTPEGSEEREFLPVGAPAAKAA